IDENGPVSSRRLARPVPGRPRRRSEELRDRGAVRDPPLRRRENLLPVPAAAILGRSRGLGRRRPGNEGSILLLCPFALPSLKTLDHAGREGVAGLDLFVATILIFEIVKSNSGSGDVVSTVPNFHILVGRHHGDSTSSLLHLALALIVEERPSAATRVPADAPPHPLHSGAGLPLIRIRNADESETTSRFSSLI